jgi:redox-sensitive bicupin YhaK (pirin superfamily)
MKVVQSPNEVTWAPAPASLPSGAQLAVISGDASKRGGTYALRLKLPDGYVFKPHWHPQNVNVTVLSGGLGIGMGDKFDESKGRIVKTGGYILEPKEMHHYAWSQSPTVIEVYGEGPFGMNYVNASDDPRNRAGH